MANGIIRRPEEQNGRAGMRGVRQGEEARIRISVRVDALPGSDSGLPRVLPPVGGGHGPGPDGSHLFLRNKTRRASSNQSLTEFPYYPALAIQQGAICRCRDGLLHFQDSWRRIPQLLGWRTTNRHHLSTRPSILSAADRPSPALPSSAFQQAVLPVFTDWLLK